jgi:endoglucanase Acf2
MADPAYIVNGTLTDGEAWVGIATTTLGADATTVTFTSTDDGQVGDFSQYMDLVVIAYVASDRAAVDDFMLTWLNGDTTTSNYSYQTMVGDGRSGGTVEATASAAGGRGIDTRRCAGASSTNMFAAFVINLFDVNSGKYKSALATMANDIDSAVEGSMVGMATTTWKSQAPITSIVFGMNYGDVATGSMFSLFGVLPRMVA